MDVNTNLPRGVAEYSGVGSRVIKAQIDTHLAFEDLVRRLHPNEAIVAVGIKGSYIVGDINDYNNLMAKEMITCLALTMGQLNSISRSSSDIKSEIEALRKEGKLKYIKK